MDLNKKKPNLMPIVALSAFLLSVPAIAENNVCKISPYENTATDLFLHKDAENSLRTAKTNQIPVRELLRDKTDENGVVTETDDDLEPAERFGLGLMKKHNWPTGAYDVSVNLCGKFSNDDCGAGTYNATIVVNDDMSITFPNKNDMLNYKCAFKDNSKGKYIYSYSKVDDLENVISKSSNTSTSTQSRDRTNLFTVSRALAGGQVVGGNSNNSGNEYHFDINSDGYIDELKINSNNKTTHISYGNSNVSEDITNHAVRKQILRALNYDEHSKLFDKDEISRLNDSVGSTSFYVKQLTGEGMTIGSQAEDVLEYMIKTNEHATGDDKIKDAFGFSGLIDNIATARVTGEYKLAHFLKQHGNSLKTFHNETSEDLENVYRDSFGEETTLLGYSAHIFGSSVIAMVTHDFNPSRSANRQLKRLLGTNLESFIGQIDSANGYTELNDLTQDLLDTQVNFYKGRINATATKMGGLKEW